MQCLCKFLVCLFLFAYKFLGLFSFILQFWGVDFYWHYSKDESWYWMHVQDFARCYLLSCWFQTVSDLIYLLQDKICYTSANSVSKLLLYSCLFYCVTLAVWLIKKKKFIHEKGHQVIWFSLAWLFGFPVYLMSTLVLLF